MKLSGLYENTCFPIKMAYIPCISLPIHPFYTFLCMIIGELALFYMKLGVLTLKMNEIWRNQSI